MIVVMVYETIAGGNLFLPKFAILMLQISIACFDKLIVTVKLAILESIVS